MGRKKTTAVADPIKTQSKPDMDQIINEVVPDIINDLISDEADDTYNFSKQFNKMYQITDKIVSKILSSGGTLKQDSYVVREEFGEALAAGYRYLRFQGDVSAKLRKAGHDNEERDYANEMYEEIADVFMMSTSYARHHDWTFENKPMDCSIYLSKHIVGSLTGTELENYLKYVSEVLYRINTDSINEDYLYEFMGETFTVLLNAPGVLDKKIDKLYNKIFKIVE